MTLNRQRPLDEALRDLVEKSRRLPEDSAERVELERMIRLLKAEIEERKKRDQG